MKSRLNRPFAHAVEQAIVIQMLSNDETARAFLAAQGLTIDTIARVLSGDTDRRRYTDTPSAAALRMCAIEVGDLP